MCKRYMEIWSNIGEIKAFFSYKDGACEGSPYRNEQVFTELGLEKTLIIWPCQIHKDNIETIDKRRLKESEKDKIIDSGGLRGITCADTDAVVTNLKNVLLTTVHADCTPVFFYDEERKAIGLAHAGWRGTNMGIAAKTAEKMIGNYDCKAEHIKAYIGPAISECCFEVGGEVYEEFKRSWNYTDEFTRRASEQGDGKYYIDLKGLNKRQLMDIGIDERNITVSPHCTCCEPELFCSYRREGGTYMRMGAGICLI